MSDDVTGAAPIRWQKGGEAWLVSLNGDAIVLRSTIPSPPGSRIDGVLEDGTVFKVKIHGSKKGDDGRFRLEGRTLDLTRDGRARLAALLGGTSV